MMNCLVLNEFSSQILLKIFYVADYTVISWSEIKCLVKILISNMHI